MKIKALIMDVDGTLTDGCIYIGSEGEIMKRFDVKDGYAIHNILPSLGIKPIIITGRESKIVERRCKELGITELVQGSSNKVKDMINILAKLDISLEETAYIGDDFPDKECMEMVSICGCPMDAIDEIKSICNFISTKNGGNGAVRDFIEWIRDTINNDTK